MVSGAPQREGIPGSARLPSFLKPVAGVDLIRVGPIGDGGYVIPRQIPGHVGWLLSLGLGADWRFEEQFQALSGTPVTAYDHTVHERFWARRAAGRAYRRLTRTGVTDQLRHNPTSGYRRYRRYFSRPDAEHRRLAVGDGTAGSVPLSQILAECPGEPIFLKMDIEGAEWLVLDDLVAGADRFAGMAIEFHDVPAHLPQLRDFVQRLARFPIVNVAANNVGGVDDDGVARVVEVTVARRDLFDVDPALPRPDLNTPNSSLHPPLELRFADPLGS